MMYQTSLLALVAVLGLAILLFARWIPINGQIILSNVGKGSRIGLLFIVGWFVSLAIVLIIVSPNSITILLGIIVLWCVIAFFAWSWSIGAVAPLQIVRPESHLIHYWVAYVQCAATMKENNTYLLKLGFIDKFSDFEISTSEDKKKLEELLGKGSVFHLPKYEEQAMVESGTLVDDRRIKVTINAPAFSFDSKEYQINIDNLVKTPLEIPCLSNKRGSHHIVFDFYDQQNQRRGGIAIPLEVREREPIIISERATRTIQIIGGVLGLVSAVILILEKILPLLF